MYRNQLVEKSYPKRVSQFRTTTKGHQFPVSDKLWFWYGNNLLLNVCPLMKSSMQKTIMPLQIPSGKQIMCLLQEHKIHSNNSPPHKGTTNHDGRACKLQQKLHGPDHAWFGMAYSISLVVELKRGSNHDGWAGKKLTAWEDTKRSHQQPVHTPLRTHTTTNQRHHAYTREAQHKPNKHEPPCQAKPPHTPTHQTTGITQLYSPGMWAQLAKNSQRWPCKNSVFTTAVQYCTPRCWTTQQGATTLLLLLLCCTCRCLSQNSATTLSPLNHSACNTMNR